MRFWFSSLQLPAGVVALLEMAGLESWPASLGPPENGSCVLVYDSPEKLIGAAAEARTTLSSSTLAQQYKELLRNAHATGQPLLAGWRIERIGGHGLRRWLAKQDPGTEITAAEPISPLLASVVLSLLDTQPELLNAFADIELQAELLGSEPELNDRQRLLQAAAQADPLPQLLAALHNRDDELQQAREEAELALLQLHQVQEELKQLFLADRQKQQLLDTRNQEFEALEQQLRPQVAILEQQLQGRTSELQEAREEAELILLQLHQVQEELEHYFLQSRSGSQLVEAQAEQLSRAKRLLARLQMTDLQQAVEATPVAVELLAATDSSTQTTSLQVQALLDTYASCLKRAESLLAKAIAN